MMTTLEQSQELEKQISSGMALDDARFHFSQVLANPQLDIEAFESTASHYINTLQNRWFEQSIGERYDVMNNLGKHIKIEMALIMPKKIIEPIEDIDKRIKTYITDEIASELIKQGISPYPRALTLTLLDLIDSS